MDQKSFGCWAVLRRRRAAPRWGGREQPVLLLLEYILFLHNPTRSVGAVLCREGPSGCYGHQTGWQRRIRTAQDVPREEAWPLRHHRARRLQVCPAIWRCIVTSRRTATDIELAASHGSQPNGKQSDSLQRCKAMRFSADRPAWCVALGKIFSLLTRVSCGASARMARSQAPQRLPMVDVHVLPRPSASFPIPRPWHWEAQHRARPAFYPMGLLPT